MHYRAGKFRIAKHIAKFINHANPIKVWEPFCGACWVTREVSPYNYPERAYYASDINHYLISLYKAIKDKNGWTPPDTVEEDEYNDIKNNPEYFSECLVGFVGIGCSWGGKWFGGYARDGTRRNYALNAKNSLMKLKPYIEQVNFSPADFMEPNTYMINDYTIYCDPPYKGTTAYGYLTNDFDHDRFWDQCRKYSKNNVVIVSEYEAPDDFVKVGQFGVTTDLRGSSGRRMDRVERLFVPQGQEHLFENLT